MDALELAQKVQQRRAELGLSQQALAERAHVSRNYISLIERGEAPNVSTTILEQITTALQLTLPELLDYVPRQRNAQIPPALWEMALEEGLSASMVDKLIRIPRRGKEPANKDEWHRLYLVLRDYID